MSFLERSFGLSAEEEESLAKTVGRVRSIGDFLADAVEGTKNLSFVRALAGLSPWIGAIGATVTEVVPAVKFVALLLDRVTGRNDPNELGRLAFTIAYQHALVQAVQVFGKPDREEAAVDLDAVARHLRELSATMTDEVLDFCRAPLSDALLHPFVTRADDILRVSADAVGYSDKDVRRIENELHQRFIVHLQTLLSHRDTAQKFEPFRTRLELGTGANAAVLALMEHAQYHRALYQEAPVFGSEQFALQHIYTEMDCSNLTWEAICGDTRDGNAVDPFSERGSARSRLGETVLDLIGDPKLDDGIVIQGVAGAGKSSFTLWLTAALVKEGLRPIRILLRDVRLDRNRPVAEALGEAIRFRDENERSSSSYPRPDDPFNGNAIFKERVRFRRADICPYVLILDGWDEISISGSEGYKARVNRLLENIRSEFLSNRDVPVRVILTGRPSAEVADSAFLLRKTPVLTLRPFTPRDLREFFTKLVAAVTAKPIRNVAGTGWPAITFERYRRAYELYEESFDNERKDSSAASFPALDILGLPLLAFLAARLLAHVSGTDADAVLGNPTTLYRNLVDLTSGAAGKYGAGDPPAGSSFHLGGRMLRDLLRKTAAAVTNTGEENISYAELEKRLDLPETLAKAVEEQTRGNVLSQLMISYYFKGGHTDLGCEFLHKSFREYLYAESIVELLKRWVQKHGEPRGPREPYWKDFAEDDPRYELSRELSLLVSAQWLRPEVIRFLGELIEWEIARAVAPAAPVIAYSEPTQALTLEQWTFVRDALADLWEWWAEGVHLRPQPRLSPRKQLEYEVPFAQTLVEQAMPLALAPRQIPEPPRIVTVDAHLGDALFRLNTTVHFQIAEKTGWLDAAVKTGDARILWLSPVPVSRKVQHGIVIERIVYTLFSPAAPAYWQNYVSRINAAGWRPVGPFPAGCDMRGIDLARAEISGHLSPMNWFGANLGQCDARGAVFLGHVFDFATMDGINLSRADLSGSLFRHAMLHQARFQQARISACSFANAQASGAEFFRADAGKCDFGDANLNGAAFSVAAIAASTFRNADLRSAIFDGVDGVAHFKTNLINSNTRLPQKKA